MPYTMRHVDGWQVRSPHGIKAKRTTKRRAVAQIRLLNMKKRGITPKGGWRKKKRWSMVAALRRR